VVLKDTSRLIKGSPQEATAKQDGVAKRPLQPYHVILDINRETAYLVREPVGGKSAPMQVMPVGEIGTLEPGVLDPLAKINVFRIHEVSLI
jgi:hypothetical protein